MSVTRASSADATVAAEEPRRVGLVSPLPPQVGGMPGVAEWLLGHAATIGCRYDAFDLWRPPDEEKGGRLRLSTIPRQLRLLVRYVRWLRGAPPLLHYSLACSLLGLTRDLTFMALARLSGRTVVAHIHGSELVGIRRSSVRARELRLLTRLAAQQIAVSPRCVEELEDVGVASRCIYNPVRFQPSGRRARPSFEELRLLFVGTFGARKGCPELVEALAKARCRGVRATLTLVGKEELRGEEEALRMLVREHGVEDAVEFCGVLPPELIARAYESAHVLCLPSHKEQLPMAILEAMAVGLAVLATPVGGIPDVVENGENGLLVAPGDVEELAAAIEMLYADRDAIERMGEAGRERVSALAGAEAIAAQWRAVYESCDSRWAETRERSAARDRV